VALVIAVAAAIAFFALLEGDIPDAFGDGLVVVRETLRNSGGLGAVLLLYLEESGVPMPVPGDVFVMYLGHHVPQNLAGFLLGWISLIVAVLLGATNLYFISRRWGRRLVEHRLGRVLHLTPDRVQRAEQWFHRWGPWALVFGRHIPGFRVPLTVGAGIFNVSYPMFAISVVISTTAWAGIFMFLGFTLGAHAGRLIHQYRALYLLAPVIVGAFLIYFGIRVWRTRDVS
jgi:membrane protein DedA with SNARE-associated domain